MEHKVISWVVILCLGLVGWLYVDVRQSLKINYEWHNYLINSTTGDKIKPKDIYDLAKIINVTEEYINSTNAFERLYDLEYNINVENPFASDQVYSDALQLVQSGWPVANQSQCGKDLKWIADQLSEHSDYALVKGRLGLELTQFMDSFGKPESGLYSGLVTWLGSYKQCKRSTLNGGLIRTRYCIARMRPKWWPKNETIYPKTRIRVGICLPETCDTMSFKRQKLAIETLMKFDMSQFFRDNLELDSIFCLPDERSPIRQIPLGGRIFLYVIGSWLSIVIIASICYEIIRKKLRRQAKESMFVNFKREFWEKGLSVSGFLGRGAYDPSQQTKTTETQVSQGRSPGAAPINRMNTLSFELLESISIHKSLKDFKTNTFIEQQQCKLREQHDQDPNTRVNLCCLSSVKFLMAILVILGHSGYLNSVYTRSLTNRVDLNTQGTGYMIMSIARCVDTFFVFFGVLTSYTLLRKLNIKQLSNPLMWIGVNAGILLRIGPVFLLVYCYSRLISPYTGEGPWWDYGVFKYSMKGKCMSESWWKSLLYFGCSDSPPVAACVLPAWFLVSYSQLSLLIPLITYLLYKLPNHITKYLLILFTTGISCTQLAIKMYKQTSLREEAFSVYGGFLVDLVEKFQSTGTMSTLGRVGCVTVGCYVGYLLRMYEQGKIREWPKWFRSRLNIIIVCAIHLIIIFMPLISHLSTKNGWHIASLDEFVGSYVVTLMIWPVLNSILLINSVTVCNRLAFVRLAAHSFWHSANKLGLCIYLVHWEVIFIGVTGFEHAPSMGFLSDVFKLWAFGVFFSILIALVIHIMIDAPLAALTMVIFRHVQARFSLGHPGNNEDGDEQKQLDSVKPSPQLSIR
jgi:hypothetical protein